MITVTHLITELSTGGAQMALYRLLANLDRSRFAPTVICLYNGDGMVADQIRTLGIKVIDLNIQRKTQIAPWVHLYHYLRQQRPTILHTWMYHANIPGRVAGRLAHVPIIISSERTMGQEGSTRLLLNRITARWVDHIICVSENVRTFAHKTIGLPENKLVVVPNGLDLKPFQPLSSKEEARRLLGFSVHQDSLPVLIGTVGRPRPVKGYDVLVETFAKIIKKQSVQWSSHIQPYHLLFIGDGPEKTNLMSQAAHLGISEHITFLPDQANIPDLLPAFDIFVSSSHWEGMPNVILEAMAASLPVVATAVGGTPEVVVDGKTGLLVSSANTDSLAQAITQLLQNPEQRATMGQAGRKRVECHFSITKTVRKTEKLYKNLYEVL